MAQTQPTITGDFSGFIKPDQAEPYFAEASKLSAVQSLARQVPVGPNGVEFRQVTSKPTANWVDEGGRKPTTKGEIGLRSFKPHKIAAITVASAEVVRANPGNYINLYREEIAEAFAVAFDYAALWGIGGDGTGSGPFDAAIADTSKSVALGAAGQAEGGIYADLNGALQALVADKRKLTGWVLDDTTEPVLNSAVDLNGRPLFVESPYDGTSLDSGRLLRRPAVFSEDIARDNVVGFAGNWEKAIWGVASGISYDVSTQATVTIDGELVSLWENNLVAIRTEAEYGFLLDSEEHFVKITEGSDDDNGGDGGGSGE